jgi:hypothetical protein
MSIPPHSDNDKNRFELASSVEDAIQQVLEEYPGRDVETLMVCLNMVMRYILMESNPLVLNQVVLNSLSTWMEHVQAKYEEPEVIEEVMLIYTRKGFDGDPQDLLDAFSEDTLPN